MMSLTVYKAATIFLFIIACSLGYALHRESQNEIKILLAMEKAEKAKEDWASGSRPGFLSVITEYFIHNTESPTKAGFVRLVFTDNKNSPPPKIWWKDFNKFLDERDLGEVLGTGQILSDGRVEQSHTIIYYRDLDQVSSTLEEFMEYKT